MTLVPAKRACAKHRVQAEEAGEGSTGAFEKNNLYLEKAGRLPQNYVVITQIKK